jgi:hypothetical protein
MSNTKAKASIIIFEQGNGASPETFTALGEVVGVPEVSMEMGEADATNMGSPQESGAIHDESIGTKVVRMGDVTVNLNADLSSAGQIALMTTRFLASSFHNYRIKFPEHGRMITFTARVKNYSTNGDIDAKSNLDVVLKPSGARAWGNIPE